MLFARIVNTKYTNMGKNAGGSGTGKLGDSRHNKISKWANADFLRHIPDKKLRKSLVEALETYDALYGVEITKIMLSDNLGKTPAVTNAYPDGRQETDLNRTLFSMRFEKYVRKQISDYNDNYAAKTRKPEAHIITHEMAHATWADYLSGEKHKKASNEIRSLYTKFRHDKRIKGYGEIAYLNPNEFWAETLTKSMYGNQDYYTRRVKEIIHKYKLGTRRK